MSPEIRNVDLLIGPHRRLLAEAVMEVAHNFDVEYMRPDDPGLHGRRFEVAGAEADLIMRLTRDARGREAITILEVQGIHTNLDGDDEGW